MSLDLDTLDIAFWGEPFVTGGSAEDGTLDIAYWGEPIYIEGAGSTPTPTGLNWNNTTVSKWNNIAISKLNDI